MTLDHNLAHIYWLGGSPCAGKSSMADMLAEQYRLQIYRCDDFFEVHTKRARPDQQPTLYQLRRMTWDEIWLQPVAVLLRRAIEAYQEEFGMILDDLLAWPKSPPLLVEGTALLPDYVNDILSLPRRSIWVVPTEAFQQAYYPKRGAWVEEVLNQCTDPNRAFQNWMDRDVAYAKWVEKRVTDLGLFCIRVDGSRTIAQNAAVIADHFQMREIL
jgi:hypothetical protein